jgi:signal transduction histidine kinase
MITQSESARSSEPEGRLTPLAALYPGADVLDEVGLGLLLFDQGGEVAATNTIADELVRRRVDGATLLLDLLGRISVGTPRGGDQEIVPVLDAAGRRSLVGYRFVRSPRLGTVFTLRDITELERARADRQALVRLSQIGRACAMVAHEIGNPLAAIKATLQSIEGEAEAAGLGDPIRASFREIDRLDKILAELLGFVRHRPPRRVRVDLAAVIARAREAAGKRLDGVAFLAPPGPLPPVLCDPDQMEQVFLNLFLNAADAVGGRGELHVRAARAGERLVIRVEDSGAGVPPELRDQVFESFFTTKPAGVGLGLPVCFRILSDHEGSISIEDREGQQGASVRLTLPLSPQARAALVREAREERP